MGKTLAEKILGNHTEEGEASAGDIVVAKVDFLMVNEALTRIIPILEDMGVEKVWDPDRILVVNDHWAPASDTRSAEMHIKSRRFVKDHGITHFCDINCGIAHQVLPEMGLVKPGDLIVGSDSHTTTYGAFNSFSTGLASTDCALIAATGENWFRVPHSIRIDVQGKMPDMVMSKDLILKIIGDLGSDGANYQSIEIHGPVIDSMSVGSRMTMCNMGVEAGAKCTLMTVNGPLRKWMKSHASHTKWSPLEPDPDAEYVDRIAIDLEKNPLEPIVATPHSPNNGKPVLEVEGTRIDQAFIGSCTNARLEDLATAARIVRGKKVHPDTRFIITPASTEVYMDAVKTGVVETLVKAGGVVTNSTCGACIGGGLGVLGPNEVCVSSTNRNFKGRMGHPDSMVYLASPATVAASALRGEISDPRSV
ncbi:MAG: 3-isopropylmalate dehydratase large subunit [Candidatus Thorarchaeota archaeon]|nr:MAG: 3-isopropylmalate dehydratase large subunit [Candidatus Thorarchaeota archaeon]